MTDVVDFFKGNSICRELFGVAVGSWLGSGIARTVHRNALDRSLVFKFETESNDRFCNVAEWQLWEATEFQPEIRKWLAPCVAISVSGNVLIQKYVSPINVKHLPKRVPKIFTDLKATNWGIYKGRPVCCDYAFNHALNNGLSASLRNANWGKNDYATST